ncbi:MAG: hypothetical protein KDH96_11930, partial [Candidatus Riesia sp.]|nr:hypothetical protein [Candidatus Riesia sp.]
DHISVKLNKNKLKKLGFNQVIIDKYDKFFNKIKTIPTFVKFVKEILIRDINNSIDNYKEMMTGEEDKSTISIYSKYIDYSNSQLEVIQNFLEDFDDNKDNWSLDVLKDKENGIQLIMQPIWAYSYLDKVVWKKYDHVIFMSGTILDKEMFSYINGLDKESTSYIEMDSTFDVKNRQIYYIKVGKMTYNERKKTFDSQVSIIKKILTKYKKSKGIIHTVNYEITEWLKDLVKDRRLLFHNGENRDEMYNKFIKSKSAKVMVSPSMMTGIDLKHDLSRFSIMLKMPYPNISSNKIKSRQDSNREWYSYKSVCDIIQTYGRTIRSETDYSDTFILDESFSNILKYNSKYLPRYFTEAIKVLK